MRPQRLQGLAQSFPDGSGKVLATSGIRIHEVAYADADDDPVGGPGRADAEQAFQEQFPEAVLSWWRYGDKTAEIPFDENWWTRSCA